ncbi:hypothetical protein J4573_29700 [Actinomadura barringtoniae]|uniref:Uncharacterized protein n=1 Tax=Actinomadura barringtoniae TaxID=1427535 RepID=A0A939TCI9_9ACTN|nr:DUF6069 family protein [Actinomadura barringtoniae]MBO2451300.1 hypothetical protein [Actinomadura barringtoniae]
MTATTITQPPQAESQTHAQPQTVPAARKAVRRARAKAAGVAVAANGAIYLAASALGVDFMLTDSASPEGHHLILPEIAVFSLVFALLGWGSLALLERFTRHAKGIWTALAGTVLALSFAPIFLEQAGAATRVSLIVIHVVVAAALLPMLRHTARRS